jgi:hypothetical protein
VPTVAELTVAQELIAVGEIAGTRGWRLRELDPLHFHLGLPASDRSWFYLLVDCDRYPVQPPAWNWCDAEGTHTDRLVDRPRGSGFLHTNGVICAPWNRLAYTPVDSRGPHGDWNIGEWRKNSHTKGCTTLPHMALRIYVELNGPVLSAAAWVDRGCQC